jgi:hypothetical protein
MIRNRTLLAVSFAVAAARSGIGTVGPVLVLHAQQHGASLGIVVGPCSLNVARI